MNEPRIESAQRARDLFETGRFKEALDQLGAAPDSPEVLRLKIDVLLALGDSESAIECYRRLSELDPDDPSALVEMAGLLTGQNRYSEAIQVYDRALDQGALDAAVHRGRALALRLNGDRAAAVEAYDAALQEDPDDGETWLAKADLLIEEKEFSDALACLERAKATGALAPSGWTSRGYKFLYAGALDEALASFECALESDPAMTQALLGKASVQQRLGQIDHALGTYDKVIESQPEDATGYAKKGTLLASHGRLSEALAYFEQAVERDPRDKASWANSGYCRNQLGDPERALMDFSKAIAIDPGYAYAWEGRGNCLDELDRPSESVTAYRRALTLDPKLLWANNNLGYVLAATFERHEEALEYYDKALEIRPGEPVPTMNKVNALIALERFEEAQKLLEQAAGGTDGSDQGMFLEKLAELFSEHVVDAEKALDYLKLADEAGYDVDTLNFAELLLRLGRHEEAREHARDVLADADAADRVVATFLLFASHCMKNELGEARRRFAELLDRVVESAATADPKLPGSITRGWLYKGLLASILEQELDPTTRYLLLTAIDLQSRRLASASLARSNPSLPLVELPAPTPPPPPPEEEAQEESGLLSSLMSHLRERFSSSS